MGKAIRKQKYSVPSNWTEWYELAEERVKQFKKAMEE